MSRVGIWIERLAIAVASLALSLGLIALLSGFFAGRDQAGLSTAGTGTAETSAPGQAFKDLGDGHLAPGAARPSYDSDPPTSGAHHPVPVVRDGTALSDDQLLEALAHGDVVLTYAPPRPPAGLASLARQLAPAFSPGLAAAGHAVILDPRSGTAGIVAVAWAHLLRSRSAQDPVLRRFISFWLGRGAGSA